MVLANNSMPFGEFLSFKKEQPAFIALLTMHCDHIIFSDPKTMKTASKVVLNFEQQIISQG